VQGLVFDPVITAAVGENMRLTCGFTDRRGIMSRNQARGQIVFDRPGSGFLELTVAVFAIYQIEAVQKLTLN